MNKLVPILTICVITYNHEKYIKKCLESIINQKTNYKFKVIVCDDCSTDGSMKIIEEYENKYPDLITAIFHERNIGASNNYKFLHNLASTEFVAHIDGDDFMYPDKISMQIDLLLADEKLSICGHLVDYYDENNEKLINIIPNKNNISRYTLPDLLINGMLFMHSSFMYRKSRSNFYKMKNIEIYDYFVLSDLMIEGDALCINTVLGGYRIHEKGLSKNNSNNIILGYLQSYLYLLQNTKSYESLILNASIANVIGFIKSQKYFPKLFLKILLKTRKFPNIFEIIRIRKSRSDYHNNLTKAYSVSNINIKKRFRSLLTE